MTKVNDTPPKLFENLLVKLISASDTESLSGDFGEMYLRISRENGKLKAVSWYLLHLLKFTVYYLIQNLHWSYTMLKNYLKIAMRNIIRQKGYSLINIGGLSIGIACSLLLFIWVYDELSYDSFHDNADSICRIVTERTTNETYTTPNTPGAFAPFVKENYPEVSDYARLLFTRYAVKYGDENNNVYLDSGVFAERSFFSIFTFPLIKGEPETALAEPNSIVISETMSQICFGDNDPMGQTLVLNNKQLCVVTGIFKDVPENSHINFNYAVPIEMVEENGFDLENWSYFAFKTYFLLKPEVDHRVFNDKIFDVYKGNSSSGNPRPVVQPLEEIHLYHSDSGLIKYLYIFSVTGFIVLCIACINFMNLRTARSGKRSVEVGLRKVLGANRSSIIRQFYSESILLSVIS
ncbi:MAG: ABC transporter permease, partial [bacterium]|nr:ABC transporter permease [bacterium]